MTIQDLVYDLKADGCTDAEVEASVIVLLDNEGYLITPTTLLIIKRHCINWQSQEVA